MEKLWECIRLDVSTHVALNTQSFLSPLEPFHLQGYLGKPTAHTKHQGAAKSQSVALNLSHEGEQRRAPVGSVWTDVSIAQGNPR